MASPDEHLRDNPHVLFPETPLRCCANRQDWTVQTVFVGDSFAEFTLTLRGHSASSSSASGADVPARPGPPSVRAAPTRVPLLQQSSWKRRILTLFFLAASLAVLPPPPPGSPTDPPSSAPAPSPSGAPFLERALASVLGLVSPSPLASLPQQLVDAGVRVAVALVLARLLVGGPRVVQQSVAATRGLGLQFTSVADDGSRRSTFLDAASVRGIIINEGLRRCGVEYYLAVVAAGNKRLLLPFDHARPRLPVLAHMYRHLTHVMCDDLPAREGEQGAGNEGAAEGRRRRKET